MSETTNTTQQPVVSGGYTGYEGWPECGIPWSREGCGMCAHCAPNSLFPDPEPTPTDEAKKEKPD
jgi:hypothetical protein